MGTVWPSGILISLRTPAVGDGISASTLSVEISKSGSSRSTLSPGFLSHLVMVPSKMLSPIWGMTTSTAMTCSPSAAGRLRDLWEPETPGFSLRDSAQPYQSTAKSTVTETRGGLPALVPAKPSTGVEVHRAPVSDRRSTALRAPD